MPLLIVLHSLGHSNTEVEQNSGMDQLANANRFAVAYPVGINQAWNAGMCCTTDPSGKVAQTDDVDFLADVISSVSSLLPIDRQRVYVAGFSNGAMMALRFACERPDLVAGVISVAGTLESSCNPTLPVRLLALHGDQDHTVPYNGSRFSPFVHAPLRSIPATMSTFATIDGCSGTTSSFVTTAEVNGYERCHAGGSVTLVTIRGAGHIWPTLANSGYDSASAIWDFMSEGSGI
jgi:polyhydroxybutyrate depolymerase